MLLSLLFVALLALTIFVVVKNAKGEIVTLFGTNVLKVVSGSMEPAIHTGDYIRIQAVDPATLEVGDIITFFSEDKDIFGMLNTHRIVSVNSDGTFTTKGDANVYIDTVTVQQDKILGKYSGNVGFLKWIDSFGSKRKILLLAVILPILAIAIYELRTIIQLKDEVSAESKEELERKKQELIRKRIEEEKQKLIAQNLHAKGACTDESGKADEGKNG